MADQTSTDEVIVVGADVAYQGYVNVAKLTVSHLGKQFTRELIRRGNSVCVLLYDEDRDMVLLTEQFRPGASPSPGRILECVAGMIDDNETAIDAICREVREETSLIITPKQLRKIGAFMLSPGILDETTTVFLAPCSWSHLNLNARYGEVGEHESIRLVELNYGQLDALIRSPNPVSATLQIAVTKLWDVLI